MRDRNAEAAVLVVGCVLLTVLAIGQEKHLEWTLKPSGTAGKLHLSLEISKPHYRSSHSTDVPVDRFRGLPPDVFDRGGAVKFEYVHDAGRLLCQGRSSWSKGSGTFTFVPDPQFAAKLQGLGYEAPDAEQAFQMMLTDVGLGCARGIKDAGLRASTQQLLDLRNHGVKLEYIHEMGQAGYRNLTVEDYIELRDHGVTTAFATDLKNAGYDLTKSRIVELRDHGVSSRFLNELQGYGLRPSAADLVQLRDHGVTAEYLKGLKDGGFEDLAAGKITELKDHGVSTEFIQEVQDLGYRFTTREMIELRDHGVNRDYLRRVRDSGMKNLSASQIVKLKDQLMLPAPG